ncbi:MAG: hypothetical protein BWK80_62225 [Desulfobacteraceae bacterium IS3]|nr:MAG: hypothetical protein BWK80_62225 [Desulfobacteraceae bacterium IS3]
MENKNFYSTAHLIVAAIRVLENRQNAPPSVDEVSQSLSFSLEQINFICKKLDEIGIIEVVTGGYGTRLFIKDHLKIEEIPQTAAESSLREEIERFQNAKKDFRHKIASLQAEKAERQKNLFADIESKFKKNLDKT